MNDAKYIGLDVHQATIAVAVRDSRGNLVMEAILETKAETILQFIRGLHGSLFVTFEVRAHREGLAEPQSGTGRNFSGLLIGTCLLFAESEQRISTAVAQLTRS